MLKYAGMFAVAPLAVMMVPLGVSAADVVLDGAPLALNPAPITQAGRVYVPLRGVFEALGASVVYQNGTINASRRSETVSLHIGSTDATVSGVSKTLDSPPFIIGAATYVPLRFVAQALGARVRYDYAAKTVVITRDSGAPVAQAPLPQVHLSDLSPAEGASLSERRPAISANFSMPVMPNSVTVSLDGLDVSNRATITSSGIVYQPQSPLQSMEHHIAIAGITRDGTHFDKHWSFTTGTVALHDGVSLNDLHDGDIVGREFTVRGRAVPHAHVIFRVGEHEAGIADAGGDGYFSSSVAVANIAPGEAFTLNIAATDPGSSAVFTDAVHLRQAY